MADLWPGDPSLRLKNRYGQDDIGIDGDGNSEAAVPFAVTFFTAPNSLRRPRLTSPTSLRPILGSRDSFVPTVSQQAGLRRRHLRLKAAIVGRNGCAEIHLPKINGEAGQVCGPERGRFRHCGTNDRHAKNVGLEL